MLTEPSARAPRTCVHDVRFSEVGEARAAYIPADPAAAIPGGESRRRADGDATVRRSGDP